MPGNRREMTWRCANDLLGYCYGKPDWKEKPAEVMPVKLEGVAIKPEFIGGECVNDPRSCSQYVPASKLYAGMAEKLVNHQKSKKAKGKRKKNEG